MSNSPYKFAVIGVAGFIAPRHLKAIKETNNTLVAALDKFDSVGIMDSFFPNADFFVEFERFDRHLDKLRRASKKVDYISICSPNYLHDSHIRFALRNQANAICEKPLVLNPWNIDGLVEIEKESGSKVYNVLQLRLHETIIALREKIKSAPKDKIYDIDLTYITSRGNWYHTSWKGDNSKSGGVATNIGVHFFDMLAWIFGSVKSSTVNIAQPDKAAGTLTLENANVRWFLSIDANDLSDDIKAKGQRTFRSIQINKEEFEFSEGFTELHTKTYQHILSGKGFGLTEARQAIETVFAIRNATPVGLKGEYHPFCKKIIKE
jgi:UDP-N-acetyl-2-amino-2-deoxyglucuronate dehydrogenase